MDWKSDMQKTLEQAKKEHSKLGFQIEQMEKVLADEPKKRRGRPRKSETPSE